MKLNDRIFYQILNQIVQSSKKSAADNTSSFSDILLWYPHPELLKTAEGCRLSIVAASFIGFETKDKEELYRRISAIAHKYKYEGEWRNVEKHLTLPLVPYLQLELYCEDRSPQDFFGNDLKKLKRAVRSFNVYNPYLPKTTRVKKPQRKRGYDDKGHLRDSSKPGAIPVSEGIIIPVTEYHRDLSYQSIYPEYKEKQNNTQCTLVEKNTSWLNSDLEGDSFFIDTSDIKEEKEEKKLSVKSCVNSYLRQRAKAEGNPIPLTEDCLTLCPPSVRNNCPLHS